MALFAWRILLSVYFLNAEIQVFLLFILIYLFLYHHNVNELKNECLPKRHKNAGFLVMFNYLNAAYKYSKCLNNN